MKNIKVMSRLEAIDYSYKNTKDDYILISISSLDEEAPKFPNCYKWESSCRGLIRLSFNDLERDYSEELLAPKQGDFSGLKTFIDTFKDNTAIKDIVVHCAAGISRSSAVAAAIAQYLDLDEFNLIWNNDLYIPNELVYRLALNEFGLKLCEAQLGSYKDTKKQLLDEIDLPLDII